VCNYLEQYCDVADTTVTMFFSNQISVCCNRIIATHVIAPNSIGSETRQFINEKQQMLASELQLEHLN
jgi:hypothetical protein